MKAITTKYHGPTDTRGARISATDNDGNRVTVPYEHALSGEAVHRVAAVALCKKMRWRGVLVAGATGAGYVYVWNDRGSSFRVTGAEE